MNVITIDPKRPLLPQIPKGMVLQFRGRQAIAAPKVCAGFSRHPAPELGTKVRA